MRTLGWIAAAILTVGCAKTAAPIEGGRDEQHVGWEPLPQPDEPDDRGLAGLPEAAAPMPFAQAVATLRASAEQFRDADDASHTALVTALRALGDAVQAVPGVENGEEARGSILTNAERIRTSDPSAMEHAEWARAGLAAAVDALRSAGQARDEDGLQARIAGIDDQVGVIAAGRPLAEQRQVVAAALLQMADALQALGPGSAGTR